MKEISDKVYEQRLAEVYPLVKSIASKYASDHHPIEDLIQEGLIGVIKAVDNYKPHRGTKFSTYAHFWIKKYILNYVSRDANQAYIHYQDNYQQDIAQEESYSESELSFPPDFPPLEKKIISKIYQDKMSLTEIAKELELPRERVRQLREKALRRLRKILKIPFR